MQDLQQFSRKLGYQFNNPELLETALTHRSYGSRNNERMEFLGDAILGYIISTELYRRFPKATEGELSRLRAMLVKGDTLAKIARKLELGEHLYLGSGELKSGGYRRQSILADAFEAIIGAIYLDSGMESARVFVKTFFDEKLAEVDLKKLKKDPKTRLQEFLQARGKQLPGYQIVATEGKAHEQRFKVRCTVEGVANAVIGEGTSRRKAEQVAAEKMLQQLTS